MSFNSLAYCAKKIREYGITDKYGGKKDVVVFLCGLIKVATAVQAPMLMTN